MLMARTDLVLYMRFWGDLAHRLELVEDPTCDTAWTDSVHLGFNPAYVTSLPFELVKTLFGHELMHVSDGHCWRRGDRDPEVWNEAGDYRINGALDDAGFTTGKGWLLDHQYDGQCVEQIYEKRKKARSQSSSAGSGQQMPQPSPPQAGGGGSGGPQGDDASQTPSAGQEGSQKDQNPGDQGSSNAGSSGKGKKGKSSGKQDPQKAPGQGNSSNDAAAPSKPRNLSRPGEVRDAPPAESQKDLEQKWKQAVAMAAKAAKGRGDFPGNLQRQVEEWLKPTVDWKSVLRQWLQECWASQDYTWRMPNPRYIAQGFYLPRLYSEQIPTLVIFWDTSASIWGRLLSAFVAESKRCVEEVKPLRVYIISCDAAVQKVDVFEEGEEIQFEKVTPVGGGGTDFRPAFAYLEKEGITPTAALFMTDLDGTFPSQDPGYPVLWATPPTRLTPPWGQHLEMRE